MFKIKITTVGKLNPKCEEDESALEAMETIYQPFEDQVIFEFGDLNFFARLNGDISDSWWDIVGLMKNLKNEQPVFNMQFPSQSFWHYWEFKTVDESFWEIRALWGQNEEKVIRVSKKRFEAEWLKLMTRVETDLTKQGYHLKKFREYANQ